MQAARVMLVDKDIKYLNWLIQEINHYPVMTVESLATSSQQILTGLKDKTIDLILMDIHLDKAESDSPNSGIQIIYDIREIHPTVKLIVVSDDDREECIVESIFAGADGYLFKKDIAIELKKIENWLKGEKCPMEVIISKFRELQIELLKSRLTQAERDVFDLLSLGLNQREISEKLFKSNATIKKQVKQILIKFEVFSTKELLKKLDVIFNFVKER
ncbi:MAG TPA: response regulator transcription factor [Bacillota bacterium]|nr:response regulator transcription factor [Bacillota bacterium]